MTGKFIDRVLREEIVNTRKYQYQIMVIDHSWYIIRLPIEWVDTVFESDGWEVVREI